MTDTSVADQEVSRFMVSTACVVYLFGYAGYCFSETLGIIRYLVYAVPPILVASLILQRAPKINNFARSYFLAYLSLGYVTYLIGIKNTAFFLNDFIIIVLVIVGFVPVISVSFDHIRNVFFCSVAYFALAYALESTPDLLVDLATLTGAARVALGPELPALFSNSDELAQAVLAAGRAEQDPLWQLPLWQPYMSMLDSRLADLVNGGPSRHAGAITAALFLQRFVPKTTPWLHVDAYAWNDADRPGRPQGGEAQGLRAIFTALEQRYTRV